MERKIKLHTQRTLFSYRSLMFISQIILSWLLHKKLNMVRSTSTISKSSQLNATLDIYCDAAIDKPFTGASSFGKGAFALQSKKGISSPWNKEETEEGKRESAESSTHLELITMLDSILLLAREKQKILCIS